MIDNDLKNIINKIRDMYKTTEVFYTIWKFLLSKHVGRIVNSNEIDLNNYILTYSSTHLSIKDKNTNCTFLLCRPQITPYNHFHRYRNRFFSADINNNNKLYINPIKEQMELYDIRSILDTEDFESTIFQDTTHKESEDIVWFYFACLLYHGFDGVYVSFDIDDIFFENNMYDISMSILEFLIRI